MKIAQKILNNFFYLFVIGIALFIGCYPIIIQAQDDSLPTLYGKSRTVNLIPFTTIDVGLINLKRDADHDGISDEDEIRFGLNPNDPADADLDSDGDGLRNGDEITLGTNPTLADTDGDGVSDGEEIRLGFDPLDPTSTPPMGVTLISISVTPSTLGVAINSLIGARPVQLTVTGTLSDNTTINLTNNPATTYQSLSTAIAVVDSLGSVLPVTSGSTSITVTNGNLTTQVAIFVSNFTPQGLSFLPLPGFANSVDVKGNYAYIACGIAGLQIIDATNPREPFIISSLQLEGSANDVKLVGNFAYVISNFGGLHIVDITDPLTPSLIGFVPLNEAIDLAIKGNYAYIAAGSEGFKIIDISNPNTASVIASLSIPSQKFAEGIDVDLTRDVVVLLFSDRNVASGVLQTIDVSDPNNPIVRGQFSFASQYTTDVAINGNLAYVATNVLAANPNSLSVINIANINAPQLVGNGGITTIGATDVKVKNGIAFVASDSFAIPALPLFSLNDPINPTFLGVLNFGISSGTQYIYASSVAVTDSLVFSTASAGRNIRNGISGASGLLIGQYNLLPATGSSPIVNIVSPESGTTVIVQDPPITIKAVVNDIPIAGVEFRANGVVFGTDNSAPYQATFNIPSTPGNITFEARAIDISNNIGISPPITLQVVGTDPFTTVIGKITDIQGNQVSGADVTLENSTLTTTTDFQGNFSFANVGTIPLGVRVTVSAMDGNGRTGRSFAIPTVRGGTTNLGIIAIIDRKTTLLPTTPVAFGVGEYDSNSRSDLFVGFDDRQSFVYTADSQGLFTPSASFALPFAAVKSGTSVDIDGDGNIDVIAQAVADAGNATIVLSDGNGNASSSSSLATGLSRESEVIAAGTDNSGKQVLAFLATTGGTELKVRISDGAGGFGQPISIPAEVNVPIRTLSLVDVTGDGLVDVIASKQIIGSAGSIVVFPRTSDTTFGTAIESPIDLRTTTATAGTIDYAIDDFTLDGQKDIAVLGDGRVRIYQGNGTGQFNPINEIVLLPNTVPIGIATGTINGDNFGEIVGQVSFASEQLIEKCSSKR